MSTRSRRIVAAAVPLGIVASGVLVWQSSYAAFTATTTNPGNSFSAGTVVLASNRAPASAMFNVGGLAPGDTDDACITVTYNGSLAADVRMYVKPGDLTSVAPGSLAPYLTLSVEEGTGTDPSCGDFVRTGFAYNASGSSGTTNTLSAFATGSTAFGSGVGSFAATGSGQSRTYRVTYWTQDDNDAQGRNAGVRFTWEAQNS